MTWNYPTANRHIPYGGHFLSDHLDNGKKRDLLHSGVDYSRYEGSDIFAIGPGKVIKQGNNTGGWGYYTYIDHGIHTGNKHAYSYYAHMQARGLAVGTQTTTKTRLGKIGKTGKNITGAHLHWGVAIATPYEFETYVFPMGKVARNFLVDPEKFVANKMKPTPPPLLPNQRQVGAVETRLRAKPNTTAPYDAKENLKPGTVITPEGWVTGQKVDNIDIWYKTDKGYAWAGGFTNKTSDNLTNLNRTPTDDALDLLRSAQLDNVEATKLVAESNDKIEQAIKLIEGTQNK